MISSRLASHLNAMSESKVLRQKVNLSATGTPKTQRNNNDTK